MLSLLYFLLIGLLAGWLASMVMKKSFSLLGYMAVGVIGAFIGGFLLRLLGFGAYGLLADLITAFLGAVILIWLIVKLR